MNNNQGFLHSHEGIIPHPDEDHVLVDKKDWLIARELFAALPTAQPPQGEIAVVLSKLELYISTGRGEYLENACQCLRQLSAHAADVVQKEMNFNDFLLNIQRDYFIDHGRTLTVRELEIITKNWDAALQFAQQPHGVVQSSQICPCCEGSRIDRDIYGFATRNRCAVCKGKGKLSPHAATVVGHSHQKERRR